MNPFVALFRAPFIVLELSWQIVRMLVQAVLLAWALAKLAVVIVQYLGRVLRNAYYRWS